MRARSTRLADSVRDQASRFQFRPLFLRNRDLDHPPRSCHDKRLVQRIIDGQIIEENNLQSHISALRAALGRDRELIRTVSGRGYQFIGEIRALLEAEPAQVKAAPAPTPEKPAPPRLSLVVLPFADIGGDPEQNHFVDGITESLTTDLSRIRGAYVVARNTAFAYKGKPLDAKTIGRELNVRYVLEGSVQRGGNRMRVNVQLIDAETGNHLWAERFDKPLADLFDMQDEIVARLGDMQESTRPQIRNPRSNERIEVAGIGGERAIEKAARFPATADCFNNSTSR
jgi:TolB-like protein